MALYELLKTALDEIKAVLSDETDYEKEAANINYFADNLLMPDVFIPKVFNEYTTRNILSMSILEVDILTKWLKKTRTKSKKIL